jgi:hypothetical protein
VCCLEYGLPNQVLLSSTLLRRNAGSIMDKVALQINAKLGGQNWGLSPFCVSQLLFKQLQK